MRAMNVNSLDEVPDSSLVHQPDRPPRDVDRRNRAGTGSRARRGIELEGWVVSGGKSSGLQPGFRMTDPSGRLYQIEVDPPSNPELASGAEIIGTAFYHAFGYHTVDVYLAELDRRSTGHLRAGDDSGSAERQARAG